jgi:hypothetical protein
VQEFREVRQGFTGMLRKLNKIYPESPPNSRQTQRVCMTVPCSLALVIFKVGIKTSKKKAKILRHTNQCLVAPNNSDEQKLAPGLCSMPLLRAIHQCNECRSARCRHSICIKSTDLCRISAQIDYVHYRTHALST